MGMLSKMLAQQFERTHGGMPVETKSLPSGLHFRARVNKEGLKEIVCWREKGFETRTPALERELATMAREAGFGEMERLENIKSGYWLVAELPFSEAVAEVPTHPSDGLLTPELPAPHSDGLPEHLRPMVEDAMQGQLERRAYFIQGYTGGMVNEPNEFVQGWYATYQHSRSSDSLSWLEAMYRALGTASVTWEELGIEVGA